MSKTTIQIDETTKAELEELKRVNGESYDSVVKMLIAKHTEETSELLTEAQQGQVRQIALETVNDRVVPEGLE